MCGDYADTALPPTPPPPHPPCHPQTPSPFFFCSLFLRGCRLFLNIWRLFLYLFRLLIFLSLFRKAKVPAFTSSFLIIPLFFLFSTPLSPHFLNSHPYLFLLPFPIYLKLLSLYLVLFSIFPHFTICNSLPSTTPFSNLSFPQHISFSSSFLTFRFLICQFLSPE